jgi:hypothetical protein
MGKTTRRVEYKIERRALGNNLTLEELSEIEEMAHRSHSPEAEIILRLSAALREAMQVRESAIAFMKRGLKDVAR